MYLDIQMKYSSLIPENEPSSDDFFSYKRIWVPKVPRSADPQFSNTCLFLLIIIRDDDLMMSHKIVDCKWFSKRNKNNIKWKYTWSTFNFNPTL